MKLTDQQKAAMHKTALKQFKAIQDKEADSRKLAIADVRFTNVVGAQSEDAFDKREDVYRGEINRVAGLVDQVTGGQRENRTNIKYLPTGKGTDNDTANIKTGITRHIENSSDANSSYDIAFEESVTGGYGGWRIVSEYEEEGFDQLILIKPVFSAASSLFFDVNSTEYTKKDAKHAFLVTGIHPDLFDTAYPNATISDFPRDKFNDSINKQWVTDDQLLIAEYWWKEPTIKKIAQLTDGRVIDLEEEKALLDELALKGITIATKKNGAQVIRDAKTHKVFMMKMNGAEFLTEPKEFPSKFIPLVPEYGRISHIENETHIRGLIRFAKDPQKYYNYETSNQIQISGELLDDPIWMTAKQAEGYEDDIEGFKINRPPVMLYNTDPEAPGAPARTGAPSVQQGAMARIKQAEMDIYATTNMYPPSLGLNVGLESGVALRHQDEKGDRGSYVFIDNHLKSIKYSGEIIEDMIGRINDVERAMAILNVDGTTEMADVNKFMFDEIGEPILDEQTGEQIILNDLRKSFATTVSTSPAYNTRKEESLDQLIAMIGADDTFRAISTDLIAKNANILESDELYKRARKLMIKQGLIDPTDEEIKELGLDQPQEPNPQDTALKDNLDMDTALKQSQIALNDVKEANEIIKTQEAAIKSYETLGKALKEKVDAGMPITQDDLQLILGTQAMIEISQSAIKPN